MKVTYKVWGGLAAMALVAEGLVFMASAQTPPPAGQQVPGQRLNNLQQQPPLQPGQTAQPGAVRVQANKPVMAENRDQEVADWLLLCNSTEVQEANLALQRADRQDVKDFAKMLAHDHLKAVEKLQQFASRKGALGNEAQGALAVQDGAAGRRLTNVAGGLPFLTVLTEISDQVLVACSREMEQKKGIAYDRAFVGSQIGDHVRVIATMKVLGEYASPELRGVIEKEIQVATGHLDRAKALEKELIQQ